MQKVTASPFMMTVQHPQDPSLHAIFEPVKPKRPRNVSASVSAGGICPNLVPTENSYSRPLTVTATSLIVINTSFINVYTALKRYNVHSFYLFIRMNMFIILYQYWVTDVNRFCQLFDNI